ncbi:MAG: 3-isopropylmalate dehydratase [Alphaproteobacteria bacterium]|nr:3-isopropylmalate dehydratase [Alphaproteobacteria bacterium]
MKAVVTTVFGSDINTDDIIRADILQEEWDKDAFAKYAFDKFDPAFRDRCANEQANIIVAGPNFGSGSSREQAIYAIRSNNVLFVVAEKDPKTGVAFPDIFYRNGVNNDLPLIAIDSVAQIKNGHILELDLEQKTLTNHTTNKTISFEMPEGDIAILRDGGLIGRARKDVKARLAGKACEMS